MEIILIRNMSLEDYLMIKGVKTGVYTGGWGSCPQALKNPETRNCEFKMYLFSIIAFEELLWIMLIWYYRNND